MAQDRLTKDCVEQPSIWRLSLLVGETGVDAVLYCPLEDHSLMHRHMPLPGQGLAALEEIIYDNPLLLASFQRTDILVDSRRFMLLPAAAGDDAVAAASLDALWPGEGETLVETVPGCGWRLAMKVDPALLSFLRRTFPGAAVRHRLSPLVAWLGNKSTVGGNARMYVHLRADGVDLLAFDHGRACVVNSLPVTDAADTVYYVLAAMQTAGLDPGHDEIHLCGRPGRREELAAALRAHAGYVMPVVFPSAMFKAGREAMEAPFEMIVLPLCV